MDILSLPRFEQMVCMAWVRRSLDHIENGKYTVAPKPYSAMILVPPLINPEKHLGKAARIYERWWKIIDKVI